MGLFGWLANHWTPAYEYREYYGNEMEAIAWECTAVGSWRGFLLGVPAGALLTVAVIGGAALTGRYPPLPPTASQTTSEELTALREENHALKRQVIDVAAATCPPGPRPVLAKSQPPTQAVTAPPHPAKQALPRAVARRKASVTVPDGQAALPIPSTCRREGDCQ